MISSLQLVGSLQMVGSLQLFSSLQLLSSLQLVAGGHRLLVLGPRLLLRGREQDGVTLLRGRGGQGGGGAVLATPRPRTALQWHGLVLPIGRLGFVNSFYVIGKRGFLGSGVVTLIALVRLGPRVDMFMIV